MIKRAIALLLSLLYTGWLSAQSEEPLSAVELYEAGRTASALGEHFRAIESYQQALSLNPNYLEPLVGLAETYWLLDEYNQARLFLEQAYRFGGQRNSLLLIDARLKTSEGDFDEAEQILRATLSNEPHNVDILLGFAELATARSQPNVAIERFLEVLRVDPQNLQAQVALALLYDDQGAVMKAEEQFINALRTHPQNPLVYILAGEHYLSRELLTDASRYANTSLTLRPSYRSGIDLLSRIALQAERYFEALDYIEQLIALDARDDRAWYLRGVIYDRLAQRDASLESFRTSLAINQYAEIPRVALEDLLRTQFDVENPLRTAFAQYHFERGDDLRQRNFFLFAQQEYRRGLLIDPFHYQGRLDFAEIYLLRELRSKYLQELEVLITLDDRDENLTDQIEIYRNLQADSVGARWDVDQFTLNQQRIGVDLYISAQGSQLDYALSLEYLGRYFRDTLQFEEIVDVRNQPTIIDSLSEGLARSRTGNSDYFIILQFQQQNRNVQVAADLYSSHTGVMLQTYRVIDAGTNRLQNAIFSVVGRIVQDIPLRGMIIGRRGETALINLGTAHGLTVDNRLVVVPRGRLLPAPNALGYIYNASDAIGEFTITRVDDLISEGLLSRNGLFDLFEIGNEVIVAQSQRPTVELPQALPPIYRQIRTIR